MRAPSALLWLLVTAGAVAACSGTSPGVRDTSQPAAIVAAHGVSCNQNIAQVDSPGGRVVLGVLAVPSAHIEPGAPTGTRPWAYFSKAAIAVRAGSPAILITVPEAWRQRAAIDWGNTGGALNSLRLAACPRQPGPWSVYAGGFYLRSAAGCVPLAIEIAGRIATLDVAVGHGSCGEGSTGELRVAGRSYPHKHQRENGGSR